MNRRKFIKLGSASAAGLTILNFPVFGKMAPSNKVLLAVMGVNNRGSYLANCFSKMPNIEIAYICDVEDKAIQNGLNSLKHAARKPAIVKDIRKLVEQKDFDALVVASPDHWHAPATLMAVANNKHVYLEKPCGHNPYEGELLVQAMNKYGKIIQMGNQRRSFPTLIQAVQEVRNGIIGTPYLGKSWYANNRKPIGIGKKVPVPPTLDFDLWQGPAPRRDYKDNIVHYNWHWFWHWGTSETCNNATHEVDCCRWFLDVDYPTKVTSAGGRYAYKDDWETPDTQIASFEFGDSKVITWEGRSCNNFPMEGSDRGFTIYGTNGTLVNSYGSAYKIFDTKNKLVKEVKSTAVVEAGNTLNASGNDDLFHLDNFLKGIRGEAKINSPMDEGHKSILLCHLASIAQRVGRTLHCDVTNGHILHDKEAMALWRRKYEKGWEPKV